MMNRTKKEQRPLLMSLLFVLLGTVLLWASRRWTNDPATSMGDAVFVSLLVMPILIYAIISGSLTELKGPGGLAATFNTFATATVSETDESGRYLLIGHDRVSIEEDSRILAKGGIDILE